MQVNYLLLIMISVFWGGSFLLIKLSEPEFGAATLLLLRFLIAAITLWLLLPRSDLPKFKDLAKYSAVAMFGNILPFLLLIFALRTLDSAVASIINALTPMFGLITAMLFFAEKATKFVFVWILVGFFGVVAIFISYTITLTVQSILPVIASISVCLCYAFSSNFVKTFMHNLPAANIALYSQVLSTLFMLPMAVWSLPDTIPSIASWFRVLALGVFSTCFAKLAYYHLIQEEGVNFTMLSIYLTPVFGMLFGFFLLDEQITWLAILGLILIWISVYGVSTNKGALALAPVYAEKLVSLKRLNRN
jgi:drug/metabolite transporter (DMT)-like permease